MLSVLLLIIIYISFISLGLPDSLLGATWPSMYGGFGVPVSYAGILSMITAGGTIISSMFSGKLIRKAGTGAVTAISVLMTATALFGISVADNFVFMCICAIPLGFGAGSVDVALNNYVALHYKAKHMSWLHCFWGVGATLGPMIISFWLNRGLWEMGYRTVSIFQFTLAAILIISLPIWRKAKNINNGNEEDKIEHAHLPINQLWKLPGAKEALLAFFCYCSIELTIGLWGGSFLVISKGIDAKTAAGWIALYYFGITFGRLLSGFFAIKLKHQQLIRLGLVLIAAGILLLYIPGIKFLLLPGLFLIGIGCAPIFPSLIHETPINFGAANSQSMIGLQMACAYVGTTFTPPAFGFIAARTGYGIFPIFISGLLIVMIFLVEKLHRNVIISNRHPVR